MCAMSPHVCLWWRWGHAVHGCQPVAVAGPGWQGCLCKAFSFELGAWLCQGICGWQEGCQAVCGVGRAWLARGVPFFLLSPSGNQTSHTALPAPMTTKTLVLDAILAFSNMPVHMLMLDEPPSPLLPPLPPSPHSILPPHSLFGSSHPLHGRLPV